MKTEPTLPALAVATRSASGPRIRWHWIAPGAHYGKYKKHDVSVFKTRKNKPWFYVVTAPDGIKAADGQMSEMTTPQEAAAHAVRGAGLWPNVEIRHEPPSAQ